MFGILKNKLSGFSEKLKQTLGEKAEKQTTPSEEPLPQKAPAAQPATVEKKQEVIEVRAKQEPVEEKAAEIKSAEKERKKTKEEKARELEEKLFKEIQGEMGEEAVAQEENVAPEEIAEKEPAKEIAFEEEPARPVEEIKEITIEEKAPAKEKQIIEQKEETKRTEDKRAEKKSLKERLFGFGKKKTEEPAKEEALPKEEGVEETKRAEEIKKALKEEPKEAEVQKTYEEEKEIEAVEEDAVVPVKEKELTEEEEKEVEKAETTEEKRIEAERRIEGKRKELEQVEIKKADEDKRELKATVGATGKLKGFIFKGIEISEKDVEDLLSDLELSLIESDVEQDAARELVEKIKQKIVGQKVSLKNLDEYLKEQIKEILTEMMATEQIDLLEEARKKKLEGKPFTILMLGPNGAGKTTSMAKLAQLFQKNNMSVIFAAGDTFRAAAIDQLEEHANKLGVRMVKQQYGADPAAVAFDAIRAAEAGKLDVVIIDSAGRQETNKNLMEELKKIDRVAKPDMKIYVGEAYAGQGLLEQAKEFDDALGINGFILTKIDADAKGGTTISLLYKLKKPILYIGTGQGYDDFEAFTPEYILKRII